MLLSLLKPTVRPSLPSIYTFEYDSIFVFNAVYETVYEYISELEYGLKLLAHASNMRLARRLDCFRCCLT